MTSSSDLHRSSPRLTHSEDPGEGDFRERLWRIVFRSDTFAGRLFDVILLVLIVVCVAVVMLESVASLRTQYRQWFIILEWSFTAIFTVEYLIRLWLVRDRWRYATSFFGVIDLISILPSYLELLLTGSHYLMTVRILRLMRMFRILRMTEHVGESQVLLRALRNSREKIIVFLVSVVSLVCVEGTMMYVLEQSVNSGFANIPQSIYWAIVTITTVGFGDVTPVTIAGKLMACVIMLTGFAIIAVPTGVVTSEMHREITKAREATRLCAHCGWAWHDVRARFCQQCGGQLPAE